MKQRIKSWKIGDYIRQFTIVAGGVLLTLWLTSTIAESAKQKQVRQAMQLVVIELRNNLEIVKDRELRYNNEQRIAQILIDAQFSIAGMSPDTVWSYHNIHSDLGGSMLPSTDALEMFKTSGIAADIADKQQIIDLLSCYKTLEWFSSSMELYGKQRLEAMFAATNKYPRHEYAEYEQWFGKIISDKDTQNWLALIPRWHNTAYFIDIKNRLEQTITNLEEAYR